MSTHYNYIPQLDYWFNNYWKESGDILVYPTYFPEVEKNEFLLPKASFIELLFSKIFEYDEKENLHA